MATPGRAQTGGGEVIEVLPPKEDGDEETMPADGAEGESGSSEWDYQAKYDGGTASGGKLHLGLRLGFALPVGESTDRQKLSDTLHGQVPLWFDLGYNVSRKVMLGVYAQAGFLIFKGPSARAGCPDDVDCSGSSVRLGAQLQYTFAPDAPTRVWLGGGVGYELLNISVNRNSAHLRGFEYLNGQFGIDFTTGAHTALGPFLAFTVAEYSHAGSDDGGGSSQSQRISSAERTLHHWVFLGIRGVSNL